jgi:hypothetical protein
MLWQTHTAGLYGMIMWLRREWEAAEEEDDQVSASHNRKPEATTSMAPSASQQHATPRTSFPSQAPRRWAAYLIRV